VPELAYPHHIPSVSIDKDIARALVADYLRLPSKHQDRCRRALERLNRAQRRRDPGDQAVELATALDLLLVETPGEHGWKVSFRTALLYTNDNEERIRVRRTIRDVYDLRSKLVHSGQSGDKAAAVKSAVKILAAIIRAIAARGGIPDWNRFEFIQS
jgi:hypothetical protein